MAKLYNRPSIDGRVIDLENAFAQAGVFVTKGTLGSVGATYKDVTEIPVEDVNVNDRYKVIEDGTYNNGTIVAQEGDYIYCSKKDGSTIEWSFYRPFTIEGPTSSIKNAIPIFYNKNGNILKDSQYKISTTSVTDEEKIVAVVKDIENHNLDLLSHSQYIPDVELNSESEHSVQNKIVYSALALKADDDKVMHLTGDETISGNKIFDGDIRIDKLHATVSGIIDSATYAATAERLGSKTIGDVNQPFFLLNGIATSITNTIGTTKNPIYISSGHFTKITETVGTSKKPVYVNSGVTTAFTETIGSINTPVYMNAGTITVLSDNVGNANTPVYLKNGTITALSNNIGNTTTPVYLNNGTITVISETVGSPTKPIYLSGGSFTAFTNTIGDYNKPLYMKGGSLTACNGNIGNTTTPIYISDGAFVQVSKSFSDYLPLTGGTINGNLSVNGRINGNTVYSAVWNDYAELFPKGEETEPGDIIALDESLHKKEQYIKATNKSSFIVGVHSNTYSHIIGGDNDTLENNLKKYIPIGLSGRVDVKFIGKSKLGQKVVPSDIPGVGCLYNENYNTLDQVIGYIVYDPLDTEELRTIKIKIKG